MGTSGVVRPVEAAGIRAARLEILLKQFRIVLAVNVVNAALVALVLSAMVPAVQTTGWAVAITVLTALRGRRLGRAAPDRTVRRLALGSALSGLLWGVGLTLMLPESLVYRLFVNFVIGGMAAGAVVTLSAELPVFYAFIIPCVLPLAVRLAMEGGPVSTGMAALLVVFAGSLLVVGWTLNGWITDTLRAQAERSRLAGKLAGVLNGLEAQVAARTADLSATNRQLAAEVAERTRAEQAAKAARDAAERADRAKSRVLAAASHDLGQPMQAMRLFADLLRRHLNEPAQIEALDRLEMALSGGEVLLRTLLDLSRLERGAVRVQPRAFPIADLLDRVGTEFRVLAEDAGIALRIRPPAQTAMARTAMAGTDRVISDPDQLHRILANLVSNAIRFTPKGGVLLTARRRGAALRIEVWDTGIGIPAAQIDTIFEEFQRLDDPGGPPRSGAGLGLAIVRHTAQLLGHRVTVRSVPGRGSVFMVTVPLAPATAT